MVLKMLQPIHFDVLNFFVMRIFIESLLITRDPTLSGLFTHFYKRAEELSVIGMINKNRKTSMHRPNVKAVLSDSMGMIVHLQKK